MDRSEDPCPMQTRFGNFHFKSVKIKTLFGKNYLIRKVIGSRKTIFKFQHGRL